jgi:hypothetical protein
MAISTGNEPASTSVTGRDFALSYETVNGAHWKNRTSTTHLTGMVLYY